MSWHLVRGYIFYGLKSVRRFDRYANSRGYTFIHLKAFYATVCALAASASACANSRCAAWDFSSASLASARPSSAMPLTASASSCAILADVAASPAFWSASVSFLTSYSCMALCASSSLVPYSYSPITARATAIIPNRRQCFTHLGWSICDSFSAFILPTGKTVERLSHSARSRPSRRFRLIHATESWITSISSNTTPTATIATDHEDKWEKWSIFPCIESLTGSFDSHRESASDFFNRRLRAIAFGAIIFYALCILEFTIGIKKSINKLFRSKI